MSIGLSPSSMAPARTKPVVLGIVVAGLIAGCGWFLPGAARRDAPMTGTNRGAADASVRLVFADGGAQDYLLPARASVTLPADHEVLRALLFAPDCTIAMEGDFGQGSDPFSVGGEIYIGPDPGEGGITSQTAQSSSPPAVPTKVCSNVPTPTADPTEP
jgi:hypothetical protein